MGDVFTIMETDGEHLDHLRERFVDDEIDLRTFERLVMMELARQEYDIPVSKNVFNEVEWL